MEIRVLDQISKIDSAEWNLLVPASDSSNDPFTQHEFLSAVEQSNCVGAEHGWIPQHIVIYENELPVAATPLYIKTNSYGEFVFDWSWADAYERSGLVYYPKLVSAIPYTPATGARLLVHPEKDAIKLKQILVQATVELAKQNNLSSVHWLFPNKADREILHSDCFDNDTLLHRVDVQFHWHNNNYQTFDDFLDSLKSARRKKIKRERKRVHEQDIKIRCIEGPDATPEELSLAEYYYRTTFDKKFGYATFNEQFFTQIADSMGRCLVLFFAEVEGETVACSICYRTDRALYGRHWGCKLDYHSLHFELCYYQGIEYCIQQGLELFEPGAQGEHKIRRGFLPTPVYSAHWISHPEFNNAISHYLGNETPAIKEHILELTEHSPYRDMPQWYRSTLKEIEAL